MKNDNEPECVMLEFKHCQGWCIVGVAGSLFNHTFAEPKKLLPNPKNKHKKIKFGLHLPPVLLLLILCTVDAITHLTHLL